jgi:hypothetical protein
VCADRVERGAEVGLGGRGSVRAPGAAAANQIRFDVGGCTYSPATTATIIVAFGA